MIENGVIDFICISQTKHTGTSTHFSSLCSPTSHQIIDHVLTGLSISSQNTSQAAVQRCKRMSAKRFSCGFIDWHDYMYKRNHIRPWFEVRNRQHSSPQSVRKPQIVSSREILQL